MTPPAARPDGSPSGHPAAPADDDRLRWSLATQAAGIGSFDWNLVTDHLDWDQQLMSIWGYTPQTFVQHIDSFAARIHPDDLASTSAAIDASKVSGTYRADYRVVRPDGTERWVQARGQVLFDGGRPVRMLGVAYDTTESEQAKALARQATDRLTLLSTVTQALGATLEVEEAVARLAHIVVPRLAEWCIVSLRDERDQLQDAGWWAADPDKNEVLGQYVRVRMPALNDTNLLEQLTSRGGEPLVIPFPAYESYEEILRTPEARELMHRLDPNHVLNVPINVRGESLGLLTLANSRLGGPFSAAEIQTTREVAARAGIALDAARAYGRTRRTSETLQRSLLSVPPKAAAADIEARYVPAQQGVEVGGDWYDAFEVAGGALMLIIGDVMGHDMTAAAQMGQLRAMLRAIAYTNGGAPAQLLEDVDEALSGLGVSALATVLVVRLTPHAGGEAGARMEWSSAGHPLPVIADAGRISVPDRRNDPPLGIGVARSRHTHELDLAPGACLYLYTDGLIERRDQTIDLGVERLRTTVGELPGLPLAERCDRLIETLAPHGNPDDMALLVAELRSAA